MFAMFGRIRRFVARHYGKIAIGALSIPLLMRLTSYAARRYITYQTSRTHDHLLRYKKQRMFEMMEENFEATFRKWYDLMRETIKKTLDADHYAELLKTRDANKIQYWTEMKIIAFANVLSLVYGAAMLTVILRIQVNVISGLLFKQMEDVPPGLETGGIDIGGGGDATMSGLTGRMITEDVQQQYMMLTRYLCTDGIQRLCELMREKARIIVGNLSLKQQISLEDLEQLFCAIRNKQLIYKAMSLDLLENDDAQNNDWCPINEAWFYMIPLTKAKHFLYPSGKFWEVENVRDLFVRELTGETYDLVKSKDSQNILKFLEAQGLNNYLDRISDFMSTLPPSQESTDESHSSEASDVEPGFTFYSAPLAKLIPVMTSFVNVPFSEDTWAGILLHNDSLKSFSANVYESYSTKDFDGPSAPTDPVPAPAPVTHYPST